MISIQNWMKELKINNKVIILPVYQQTTTRNQGTKQNRMVSFHTRLLVERIPTLSTRIYVGTSNNNKTQRLIVINCYQLALIPDTHKEMKLTSQHKITTTATSKSTIQNLANSMEVWDHRNKFLHDTYCSYYSKNKN